MAMAKYNEQARDRKVHASNIDPAGLSLRQRRTIARVLTQHPSESLRVEVGSCFPVTAPYQPLSMSFNPCCGDYTTIWANVQEQVVWHLMAGFGTQGCGKGRLSFFFHLLTGA